MKIFKILFFVLALFVAGDFAYFTANYFSMDVLPEVHLLYPEIADLLLLSGIVAVMFTVGALFLTIRGHLHYAFVVGAALLSFFLFRTFYMGIGMETTLSEIKSGSPYFTYIPTPAHNTCYIVIKGTPTKFPLIFSKLIPDTYHVFPSSAALDSLVTSNGK